MYQVVHFEHVSQVSSASVERTGRCTLRTYRSVYGESVHGEDVALGSPPPYFNSVIFLVWRKPSASIRTKKTPE